MKLAVIGGHLTPAIALIQYAINEGDDVHFIGRKHHSPKTGVSFEFRTIKQFDCTFHDFTTVKFDRFHPIRSLLKLPQLIRAVFRAYRLLNRIHPQVIISFGGYVAVPMAIAAYMRSIPVLTHEQTTRAGLANRIIARFARLIVISYESSRRYYPDHKTMLIGNLVRQEFYRSNPKPQWYPNTDKPVIYITGGNQGSRLINQTVKDILKELIKDYFIIHQVGHRPIEFEHANYYQQEWFKASEVAYLLKHGSLIISRAGANTLSEISTTGIPAILIPLKGAQQNEQYHNARLLEANGSARIITQDHLTPQALLNAVLIVIENNTFAKNAQKLAGVHRISNVPVFYARIRELA